MLCTGKEFKSQRASHAETAVVSRAATQTNNDFVRAASGCIQNHFTYTERSRANWIALTGGKTPHPCVRLGERTLIYARLADGQPITAEDEGDSRVKIGEDVPLKIDGGEAHVFDSDGTGYHAASA